MIARRLLVGLGRELMAGSQPISLTNVALHMLGDCEYSEENASYILTASKIFDERYNAVLNKRSGEELRGSISIIALGPNQAECAIITGADEVAMAAIIDGRCRVVKSVRLMVFRLTLILDGEPLEFFTHLGSQAAIQGQAKPDKIGIKLRDKITYIDGSLDGFASFRTFSVVTNARIILSVDIDKFAPYLKFVEMT